MKTAVARRITSALRRPGLQSERMQFAAHFALKRRIDDLMLLDAGFATKRFGDDGRRVVIAIAGKVADCYLGIGNARPDQPLNVICSHGHGYLHPPRLHLRLTRTRRRGKAATMPLT